MSQYTKIYTQYFMRYRRGIKGELSSKTIDKRVSEVMESLAERDRHMIMLAAIYGSNRRIARAENMEIAVVSSRMSVALNHLITPANVETVTGRKLFTHTGRELKAFALSSRTLNALRRKSDITTIDDLKKWLKHGPYQMFRLPGIGKAGLAELIPLVYTLK